MMMLNVPAIALAAMVILNISHDVALWVSGAKMAPGEATLSKNRDEQISNCKDSEWFFFLFLRNKWKLRNIIA